MNYRQALDEFNTYYMPNINSNDRPAIRQAGNDYVDYLRKDGQITEKQARNWIIPTSKLRGE